MARKLLVDGELNQTNKEGAEYDFDLFVIGAGSGGVRAARFSANYGAKVCDPISMISSFKLINETKQHFVNVWFEKHRFSLYFKCGHRF